MDWIGKDSCPKTRKTGVSKKKIEKKISLILSSWNIKNLDDITEQDIYLCLVIISSSDMPKLFPCTLDTLDRDGPIMEKRETVDTQLFPLSLALWVRCEGEGISVFTTTVVLEALIEILLSSGGSPPGLRLLPAAEGRGGKVVFFLNCHLEVRLTRMNN